MVSWRERGWVGWYGTAGLNDVEPPGSLRDRRGNGPQEGKLRSGSFVIRSKSSVTPRYLSLIPILRSSRQKRIDCGGMDEKVIVRNVLSLCKLWQATQVARRPS